MSGLNRRQWTKRLAVSVAAAPALSEVTWAQVTQKVPPQGAPAPAPTAATPDERLQKASADIRAVSEKLSKLEVPMDVEPAYSFRAY